MQILSLGAVATQVVAQIDPAYAINITAYHVNPLPFGAIPYNMNTADAVGDIFFDLCVRAGAPPPLLRDLPPSLLTPRTSSSPPPSLSTHAIDDLTDRH